MSPAQTDTKKSSRVLTFDLLRGYFMFSIIINHLQWYPNGLDWVAMRGSLVVSAAEGFFLLSGIVLGIVRGDKLRSRPFREAAGLLIRRGVLLYATSVILALLFTLLGWWFFMDATGLKPGIRPIDQPFGEVVRGILSLNYLYGWADFLRLYAVFLLMSPLALWLLRKNLWYVVIALSALLWAAYPWALEHSGKHPMLLMILSWQFIFFVGFVLGYHWRQLTTWWTKKSLTVRRSILLPVLAIASLTLIANIALETTKMLGILPADITTWFDSLAPHFIKEQLPMLRLGLFGLWFMLGYYLFYTFEKYIMHYVGWILLPFGQNSLYVYIVHAILLFFAHLIMPAHLSHPIILTVLGTVSILGLIYLAVRTRFLFTVIPR